MTSLCTLVTALDGDVPTLDGSSNRIIEVEDILQENARSYFCYGGHDFTLVFDKGLAIPYFFECPYHKIVAFCCPIEGESVVESEATVAEKALTAARA